MDTDSIIYEHDVTKYNIPEGKYLGEWECETKGKPIRKGVTTGAKSYGYIVNESKSDLKCKGITLNNENEKVVNFINFKKLLDKEMAEIVTETNLRFEQKSDGIYTNYISKSLSVTADKRVRQDNSYNTLPFGFEEDNGTEESKES